MPAYTATSMSDPSEIESTVYDGTETEVTETTLRYRGGMGKKKKAKRYRWPEIVLALLLSMFFICGTTTMGIFSYFTYVQKKMWVEIPWYFYFIISTGVLTIVFTIGTAIAYYIHMLLPIWVFPTAFVLFTFWLTGLVKMSIELWGPLGSINDNCTRFVFIDGEWGGASLQTLARIQQEGVCNMWKTSFALEMIGTFLFLYLMFVTYQVYARA